MALNYDYRKIDVSSWSKEDHQVAHGFCWTMMAVEMQYVTEENWKEILFRILFLQKIGFGPWTEDIPEEKLQPMLKKLIGYGTNVGNTSRLKFMKRWMRSVERRILDNIQV